MSERAPKPLPDEEIPPVSLEEAEMTVVHYDPVSEEERERIREQAGVRQSMHTRTGWAEYRPGESPVSKGGPRRRGNRETDV